MKFSIHFGSASIKDLKSRVTCQTPRKLNLNRGDRVILSFRHEGADYNILFYCNREDGSSLKTNSWPKNLPDLQPGVYFAVDEVTVEFI